MASQEFELIDYHFKSHRHRRDDVLVGIGDDAAVLSLPPQQSLVVAVDTLVEGVHFPKQTLPCDVGYKALAVNLSDLAAMGAVPAWATLALTLPSSDKAWLSEFSAGFFDLADQYEIALVGGDTTRGPLSLSVQLQGWVDSECVLKRDGAQEGDLIYVSGCIGDAGLGLLVQKNLIKVREEDESFLLRRLNRPRPRVELGLALRGIAHAAIDVSDGLAADLIHVLQASHVGAELDLAAVPRSAAYERARSALLAWRHTQQKAETLWTDSHFALDAGDDYELCFTVPPSRQNLIEPIARKLDVSLSLIGRVVHGGELFLIDSQQRRHCYTGQGYRHF